MSKARKTSITENGPVTEHKHGQHMIRIFDDGTRCQLWIDGKKRRFFQTEDGFNLFDQAYEQPHGTLLKAAQAALSKVGG